jgi:hypothetical protein
MITFLAWIILFYFLLAAGYFSFSVVSNFLDTHNPIQDTWLLQWMVFLGLLKGIILLHGRMLQR